MFDPITYIQTIHSELLATMDSYEFARVSSVSALEEMLEKSRRTKKFLAIDDSQDGTTFRGAGGYYERRNYTCYIITRSEYGKMDERATIMAESRAIFRNIVSRMIVDKYTIPVLSQERIQFYEVPPAFATGTCGIYFIFTVENPVDLTYDADAWTA